MIGSLASSLHAALSPGAKIIAGLAVVGGLATLLWPIDRAPGLELWMFSPAHREMYRGTLEGWGSQPGINIGDVLAFVSGIAWAFGTLQIYKLGPSAVWELAFGFVVGSFLITGATILIAGDALAAAPQVQQLKFALPFGFLLMTILSFLPFSCHL